MPKLNHPNLGDVCKSVYLPGRILKVYHAVASNPSESWDCADVLEIGSNVEYKRCPIIYHCSRTAQNRTNGAVENGARGFVAGDDVILLCKLSDRVKTVAPATHVYVFGHINGPRKCSYNYVIVRISSGKLSPFKLPINPANYIDEYCTLYDVITGEVADIRQPSNPSLKYQFPCRVADIKPILDLCEVHGVELFEYGAQGDSSYRIAGGTPSWLADANGKDLALGPNSKEHYGNWYDFDRCFKLFDDLRLANMVDFAGAINGTFKRTSDLWAANEAEYDEWVARSGGVLKATIRDWCPGGSFSNTAAAVSEEAQRSVQSITNEITGIRSAIERLQSECLAAAADVERLERSYTQASAELADVERRLGDEAATLQNMALIRSLLARRVELMSLIDSVSAQRLDASASINEYNRRLSACYVDINNRNAQIRAILAGNVVPGSWGAAVGVDGRELVSTSLHAQVAYGEDEIYACTPPSMTDGKGGVITFAGCDSKYKFVRLGFVPPAIGSITWVLGILRMIREGAYNRTTCPAIKEPGKFFGVGSYRLRVTAIPGDATPVEQYSALNTRLEYIDTWERYDNWNNTLSLSFATQGVDRTWWFRSYAQQWRYRIVFVDTPIGPVFCAAPHIQVALWYVPQTFYSSGTNSARQDWPLNNDFHRAAKHSASAICQVYVVQRQGITLWSRYSTPAQNFTSQRVGWGPYDCHYWQSVVPDPIAEDGKATLPSPNDPVAYIKNAGSVVDHVSAVDNLAPYMSPRSYIRTYAVGEVKPPERGPLTNSMHEVEVVASADLYNTLEAKFGRKHPNDQVRNPSFEKAIEDLIKYYYNAIGASQTELQYFDLDVEVL